MGGLATWMPTYFVRERGIPLGNASTTFGLLLVVAGLPAPCSAAAFPARWRPPPGADFIVSGWFAGGLDRLHLLRVMAPSRPCSGPPCSSPCSCLREHRAAQRGDGERAAGGASCAWIRGHDPADATARRCRVAMVIGEVSDQIGLRAPVLVTGCLLAAAGVVLLAGAQPGS